MSADESLDPALMTLYPSCRLDSPATVAMMPAPHRAQRSMRRRRPPTSSRGTRIDDDGCSSASGPSGALERAV